MTVLHKHRLTDKSVRIFEAAGWFQGSLGYRNRMGKGT